MTRQVITSLFALRECQFLSRFTTSFYISYPCCFTVLLTEHKHVSQRDKIVKKNLHCNSEVFLDAAQCPWPSIGELKRRPWDGGPTE